MPVLGIGQVYLYDHLSDPVILGSRPDERTKRCESRFSTPETPVFYRLFHPFGTAKCAVRRFSCTWVQKMPGSIKESGKSARKARPEAMGQSQRDRAMFVVFLAARKGGKPVQSRLNHGIDQGRNTRTSASVFPLTQCHVDQCQVGSPIPHETSPPHTYKALAEDGYQ